MTWYGDDQAHGRQRCDLAQMRAELPRVAPWSHEDPALYTLVASLHDPDGIEVDATRLRLGFRTIEIRERSLLLNGRRVMIRGANRHEHHERTGKALDRATMRADLELLKRFNFNAVRCSHYPPDPHWFELCDEHGLLCIDEANLETHHWYNDLCADPRWLGAFMDRGSRMVLRDRNHPSIIAWSLGNESGYGPHHDAMAAWMRHADPGRPIHYEGAMAVAPSWDHHHAASDLVCPMYPDPRTIVSHATNSTDRRPVIMCEYAHAMGNSCGGLADYWAAIESTPGLQGGFIWELLDHGIRSRAGSGKPAGSDPAARPSGRSPDLGWPGDQEFWAYGGDFGETVHDSNFVCDGLAWPDRTPHTAMWEAKALFQPVTATLAGPAAAALQVRSRLHFITTAHLAGSWELSIDGTVVERGRLPRLALAPGAEARLRLPCRRPRAAPGQEVHLTLRWRDTRRNQLTAPGHEVAWAQVALPGRAAAAPARARSGIAGRLAVERGRDALRLRGDRVELELDRASGRLTRWMVDGIDLLQAGPEPCLWRAPTDNDGIRHWDMSRAAVTGSGGKPLRRWMAAGLDRARTAVERLTTRTVPGGIAISLRTRTWGADPALAVVTDHRLVLDPAGGLACRHRFTVPRELPELPRLGVRLLVPTGFERLEWLGLGPHETYGDRRACGLVGRWGSTVAGQYAPHVMPQEHGHHCAVRWLSLRRADGRGLLVGADPLLEFNASHCAVEDLTAARHTTDVRFRPEVHLHLDAAHRGLGSASCGPDTDLRHRILPDRRYRLDYRLRPLAAGEDAAVLHRRP